MHTMDTTSLLNMAANFMIMKSKKPMEKAMGSLKKEDQDRQAM